MSSETVIIKDAKSITLKSPENQIKLSRITKNVYITTGQAGPRGPSGTQIQIVTQAEYDALTPDPEILYAIIN